MKHVVASVISVFLCVGTVPSYAVEARSVLEQATLVPPQPNKISRSEFIKESSPYISGAEEFEQEQGHGERSLFTAAVDQCKAILKKGEYGIAEQHSAEIVSGYKKALLVDGADKKELLRSFYDVIDLERLVAEALLFSKDHNGMNESLNRIDDLFENVLSTEERSIYVVNYIEAKNRFVRRLVYDAQKYGEYVEDITTMYDKALEMLASIVEVAIAYKSDNDKVRGQMHYIVANGIGLSLEYMKLFTVLQKAQKREDPKKRQDHKKRMDAMIMRAHQVMQGVSLLDKAFPEYDDGKTLPKLERYTDLAYHLFYQGYPERSMDNIRAAYRLAEASKGFFDKKRSLQYAQKLKIVKTLMVFDNMAIAFAKGKYFNEAIEILKYTRQLLDCYMPGNTLDDLDQQMLPVLAAHGATTKILIEAGKLDDAEVLTDHAAKIMKTYIDVNIRVHFMVASVSSSYSALKKAYGEERSIKEKRENMRRITDKSRDYYEKCIKGRALPRIPKGGMHNLEVINKYVHGMKSPVATQRNVYRLLISA